jgi:HPt (histidine-containing phosphotransfer) domain-containing protein
MQDSSLFSIEGLDAALGIEMTGGTETAYRQVLAIFCKDAAERMLLLKAFPGEPELADFVINVHALKSISGTIGAASLSKQAADLEAAGKAGDLDTIRNEFSRYYGGLQKLTEDILGALALAGGTADAEPAAARSPLLADLRQALEKEDIAAIDRLFAELEKKPLDDKAREHLASVSDQVLVTEFKAAIKLLDEMLSN